MSSPPCFWPAEVCIPAEGLLEIFPARSAFAAAEGGWIPTHSFKLCCPVCGEAWAQLRRADLPLLWPVAACCLTCSPDPADSRMWTHSPPGSILIAWGFGGLYDHELLAALPLTLARREFQLHERRLMK